MCVEQNKFGIGENIRDMDECALQDGATTHRAALDLQAQSLHVFEKIRGKSVLRNVFNGIASQERNVAFFRAAKARRRLDQRIEHTLQVKGRAADDLEYISSCGLLLKNSRSSLSKRVFSIAMMA